MPKVAPYQKYHEAVTLAQSDAEEGLDLLEGLARRYPSDSRVRHALGVTLLEVGRYAQAVRELEAAAKREREYASTIHEALAYAYSALSMPAHAARALKLAGRQALALKETRDLTGDVPAGANATDLLEFEQARFEVLHGNVAAGLRRMEGFAARFPDFLPAQNILATGRYLLGDFTRARAAAERVLHLAPLNVHALLNLARLDLLERGVAAAREWQSRFRAAPVSSGDGITDGQLALANYFALLNDDANVERALDAWNSNANERLADPQSEFIESRLRLRLGEPAGRGKRTKRRPAASPAHPYFLPRELLPAGMLERWRGLGAKHVEAGMLRDLKSLPGWLSLLSETLGFEDPEFARMVALVLTRDRDAAFVEMLIKVALHGPGETATRLAIAAVLQEAGLIPENADIQLPGTPDGAKLLQLELDFEPSATPLGASDQSTFEEAIEHMRAGRFDEARGLLEPLSTSYADFASLQFNLALCELMGTAGRNVKEAGHARLERLLVTHPQYLFARSHLAGEALQLGDLERARSLLRFPEGVNRLHVDEWAVFTATSARLALAEGNVDQAVQALATLAEVVGEEATAYRVLERAVLEGQLAASEPRTKGTGKGKKGNKKRAVRKVSP